MAFDFADFVKRNLIGGWENGSFTAEQVNIYAAAYMVRGVFTEADVVEVSEAITQIESAVPSE